MYFRKQEITRSQFAIKIMSRMRLQTEDSVEWQGPGKVLFVGFAEPFSCRSSGYHARDRGEGGPLPLVGACY
jgi:hypothetical protein